MNSYIYRKDSGHMPTKSVKITEKSTSICEDTYDTTPSLPSAKAMKPHRRELDEFLFHEGTARHAYDYLGAHAELGQTLSGSPW